MWQESAPAKLNLFLHVTGKRADGYHLLQSLVAFTDIGDLLSFTPQLAFKLTIEGPFAPALDVKNNSISKAIKDFAEMIGDAPIGHWHLQKNLPVASGLAGGTADAAAAIRLMARIKNIAPTDERLLKIAALQGADGPMCLASQTAMIAGIGEQIAPQKLPHHYGVVLVNPKQPCPTPDVFKASNFLPQAQHAPINSINDWQSFLPTQKNMLMPAAVGLVPQIAEILWVLAQSPLVWLARLSGSGATCFALTPDADSAKSLAQAAQHYWPDYWVASGQLK